ncbi:Uncharacterised protein [uncultured archaeon]|nr:Uncharacterised protein [uncultured archaeon]
MNVYLLTLSGLYLSKIGVMKFEREENCGIFKGTF